MNKVIIVVHGGAGPDEKFIRENIEAYKDGLMKAVEAGYHVLWHKGSALDAVEAAVMSLEDNPLFNAGRGSALTAKGDVQMCASIMDGKNIQAGAAAIVHNIKNPVQLAKTIMTKTKHIYLGSHGAEELAKEEKIKMEPEAYFITEHQYDKYAKEREKAGADGQDVGWEQTKHYHGTVGAVALDHDGNVAAATSTGGTEFCHEGRIADSSMIGIGSFADNETCAISCTGDGEYLMRGVIAHSVSSLIKYKNLGLKEACHEVLYKENKSVKGDIGMIAVDAKGNIAIEFNSERMHRAWKTSDGEAGVKIYPGE